MIPSGNNAAENIFIMQSSEPGIDGDTYAVNIKYDNQSSGLSAENVQNAIDELTDDYKNTEKVVVTPETFIGSTQTLATVQIYKASDTQQSHPISTITIEMPTSVIQTVDATNVTYTPVGAESTTVAAALDNKMDAINGDLDLGISSSISIGRNSGSTIGSNSIAVGTNVTASGANSQAFGTGTVATQNNQKVFGKYNSTNNINNYAEVVGGGSSDDRSNIRTLDWNGNETILGDLYFKNSQNSLSTQLADKVDI